MQQSLHPRPGSGHSDLDTLSLASSRSVVASTIWSLERETARKVPRLNDQQWIMHRKKIGLSRKIKSPKQKTGESKSRKEDIVTFIRSNFKRKECVNYVHNPDGDTRDTYTKVHRHRPCHCGATAEEHRTVSEHRAGAASGPSQHPAILEEEGEGDTRHGIVINIEGPNDWKPNLAIRDFPTNAFGNIEFDGCLSLGSKFVRLAADTEMELVRRLYCAALYITVLHCTACTVLYCTGAAAGGGPLGDAQPQAEARHRHHRWRAELQTGGPQAADIQGEKIKEESHLSFFSPRDFCCRLGWWAR